MENKIETISLELSKNLRDFISEQEHLNNEFWDYANKVIGIPKEKLGQPKDYSDYQKKLN